MIVNLVQRDGDGVVLERLDGNLFFEGGDAQIGALATFSLNGELYTGRVVHVAPATLLDEPSVDIELIDVAAHDAESQITLASLPPGNDNDPKFKI
jgi:hypothetical protein